MRIGWTSDWQAWQRTVWSCATCLEVAEDGQALEFVSEELRGEGESLSPRSSSELEAVKKTWRHLRAARGPGLCPGGGEEDFDKDPSVSEVGRPVLKEDGVFAAVR